MRLPPWRGGRDFASLSEEAVNAAKDDTNALRFIDHSAISISLVHKKSDPTTRQSLCVEFGCPFNDIFYVLIGKRMPYYNEVGVTEVGFKIVEQLLPVLF